MDVSTPKARSSVRTYFDPDEYEWIEKQSQQYGIPQSNVIQILVHQAIERDSMFEFEGSSGELQKLLKFIQENPKLRTRPLEEVLTAFLMPRKRK